MKKKRKSEVSREVGLEIGLVLARNVLKSNHLHYGYWPSGLEVHISNLRTAQENYAAFLLAHIPAGVQRVLDVGCGAGQLAKMLIETGREVDCISPSSYLNAQARQLLGDRSRIFEGSYEQFETSSRYDLILFSESFQYIDPEQAVVKSLRLLASPGHLLICDFFRKNVAGKSPIGGGHSLERFYGTLGTHPLDIVEDLDLTPQTAPTLDVANCLLREVLKPTMDLGERLLNDRYPVATRMLKYLFRRRIDKIRTKYLGGNRTGEVFRMFKSYRLLLCKTAGARPAQWQGPIRPDALPFDAMDPESKPMQVPFYIQKLEERS